MATIEETFALARRHHQSGQLALAEPLYRQVLQANPRFADAYFNLGLLLKSLGKGEAAIWQFQQALLCNLHDRDAIYQLDVALAELEKRVTQTNVPPASRQLFGQAHYNLGVVQGLAGQIEEAIRHYRKALRWCPDEVETHNNLANVLRQHGQVEEALGCYSQALRIRPDCVEAYNNLSTALTELKRFEEAEAAGREALRIKPDFAAAWNNLGEALKKQRRLEEALDCYRKALQIDPQFAEAHNSLGDAFTNLGRLDEAQASLEQALRFQPALAGAHWNRALLWLLLGDFKRGWPEYEWRWTQPSFVRRSFAQPLWDGSALGGRTILLYAEQGLGDTMQFVRYASLIKGGRVVIETQPALMRLLAGAAGVDVLVARGSPLPAFDVQAPLLSLPRIIGTSLASMPGEVPYLCADDELTAKWRRELEPLKGIRVGVAWQGNPAFPADRQRSIPLSFFARLAQVEGVQLVSLQKGAGTEQIRKLGDRIRLLDLGNRLDETAGPFMDSAAVVKNLDLVICSDSAMAHLAGALGTPVWVALSLAPDWRWLLQREDSPWYPTMRLFRQSRLDAWDDVFERMAGELLQLRYRLAGAREPKQER